MPVYPNGKLPVSEPKDESLEPLMLSPSWAQFQLWLAQAQRDRSMISDKEMAVVEKVAGRLAKKSITMFNPFTMEKRKVELP